MFQNPAFGPAQIRQFTQVFMEKAVEVSSLSAAIGSAPLIPPQLRDIWLTMMSKPERKDGWTRVDVFGWVNKASLDIIGVAGKCIPLLNTMSFSTAQDLATTLIPSTPRMRTITSFTAPSPSR
jgi:hypothetical protein